MKVRLQKFLAQCGICSRRKAEEHIVNGRVSVDGHIVSELGTQVDPDINTICFAGKKVQPEAQLRYLLLNKPKGYVTTLSDPQGRPTVVSLIKDNARLFPVGRLDLDTEGALLLTNDGELAQKIQHPSHGVNKTYEALVAGSPSPEKQEQLRRGIILEGKRTSPAYISKLRNFPKSSLMEITIHEGRKRQVKKMFAAIGHPVISLKRTAYGKLRLTGLATGEYKQLNPSDLKKIFL